MKQQLPVITPQKIFDKAVSFFGWKGVSSYYQTTAYDTTLLISESSNYDTYHEFKIFGRNVLWINQVRGCEDDSSLMSRTIFECSEDDFDGHIVAHRLSSVLCYISNAPISPRVWAGIAQPAPCVVQSSERCLGVLMSHSQVDDAIARLRLEDFNEKKWIALAHNRQAHLAQTPYYTVLSHWKIIELYFDNNPSRMNAYINQFYTERPDLFYELEPIAETASRRLRDIRHSCAHFRLNGGVTQDPDNPDLFNEVSKATFVLRRLAEGLIDMQEGWSPVEIGG